MAIFANHHHRRRPLLSTPSAHPFHSDLPDFFLFDPSRLQRAAPSVPLNRQSHPTSLSLSTPDQSFKPPATMIRLRFRRTSSTVTISLPPSATYTELVDQLWCQCPPKAKEISTTVPTLKVRKGRMRLSDVGGGASRGITRRAGHDCSETSNLRHCAGRSSTVPRPSPLLFTLCARQQGKQHASLCRSFLARPSPLARRLFCSHCVRGILVTHPPHHQRNGSPNHPRPSPSQSCSSPASPLGQSNSPLATL